MARKIKTAQEKKKTLQRALIVVVVLIVVICIGIFVFINLKKEEPKNAIQVNILKQNDNYGYTLTDKDSEYFKTEFDKLISIVEASPIDDKEYATQVAKMFTIDLYTMNTKINKYDVGGTEYYYSTKKDMFEQKVIDTLYSSLLDDTYGDRKQTLPEITNIEVTSTEETTYKLDNKTVDGYLVKLNLTYKEDLGYDKVASVVVCKEDGIRWSVVDFQPTLKPKYDNKK